MSSDEWYTSPHCAVLFREHFIKWIMNGQKWSQREIPKELNNERHTWSWTARYNWLDYLSYLPLYDVQVSRELTSSLIVSGPTDLLTDPRLLPGRERGVQPVRRELKTSSSLQNTKYPRLNNSKSGNCRIWIWNH